MLNAFSIVPTPFRTKLGEGPRWISVRNELFWVDIVAQALHSVNLADGAMCSWSFDEPIGWIIERAHRDDFVIGLKSGFASLSLDPLTVLPIGNPEADRSGNRLNDAKVDHAGRIWAGSKHDRDEAESGALYRLDADLNWARLDDGYGVANGPTFSPDGSILYHTDSARRTVYAFDLAPDGALNNKRDFIRFEDDWGYPDGMTTDRDGGIWIAHWGGGRVSRFMPDGRLDRSIQLPATNITSCAFAGPALDRLFVTSASLDCEGETDAGALFEIDAGVTGLPQQAFAG